MFTCARCIATTLSNASAPCYNMGHAPAVHPVHWRVTMHLCARQFQTNTMMHMVNDINRTLVRRAEAPARGTATSSAPSPLGWRSSPRCPNNSLHFCRQTCHMSISPAYFSSDPTCQAPEHRVASSTAHACLHVTCCNLPWQPTTRKIPKIKFIARLLVVVDHACQRKCHNRVVVTPSLAVEVH